MTGRVFEVEGGTISVADGWQHGPRSTRTRRWDPSEVGAGVRELLGEGAGTRPGLRRFLSLGFSSPGAAVAELVLQHLARRVEREFVDDLDVARHLVVGHVLACTTRSRRRA